VEADQQTVLAAARLGGLEVDSIVEEPCDLGEILRFLQSAAGSATALLASEIEAFWRNPDDGEILQSVINHIFVEALQMHASDVHVKLSIDNVMCKIHYRIDGELTSMHVMPTDCMRRLITQIKLKSGMDASERLRPQDGRMSVRFHNREIDLRVSSSAKDDGELMVVRLLDQSRTVSLETMLEAHPQVLQHLKSIADIRGKQGGLVLITGPTGMGKSTTMSGIIRAMPRDRYRVASVEDPVENRVPYVDHMSINEAIGLGFPEMLRALMRQDPDVIVVGEVRDKATAEIALRAVETGHMVLTTLHTRSVDESIVRLVSMLPDSYRSLGLFAIANNIKAVVNQVLVKKLCPCATATTIDQQRDGARVEALIEALGVTESRAWVRKANGCPLCGHSGYRGRVLVPEAAFFTNAPALRQALRSSMISPNGMANLLRIPGVTYVSRESSLRVLLAAGICDLMQAGVALDLPC
jgi:type II secretory ATPase GspE/PulE/Tfp pilus assembly ATPase PilB-like protein